MPAVRGRIGRADTLSSANDLVFQYNPTTVRRARRATYARNGAAMADLWTGEGGADSLEWIRNEPEEISLDLFFHADGKETVERYLKALDEFLKPDPTTGRPPPLVLVLGNRSDRVRLTDKEVEERLFDQQLNVQEARVQCRFTTLAARSTRGR
jgi:hypothetical protein